MLASTQVDGYLSARGSFATKEYKSNCNIKCYCIN